VLGLGALLVSHRSQAADHLDAPATQMAANHMADINDVYAWMTSDGTKVNLVMSVGPAENGTHAFGPSVQYVFHVSTHPGATNSTAFATPGTETKVICTFASNTSATCWVASGTTVKDYVTGDPSNVAGVVSQGGSTRLFAGIRSDPFFFNLAGFLTAQGNLELGCGASNPCPGNLAHDVAGCPTVSAAGAGGLRTALSTMQAAALGPCPANQIDCFAGFNTNAIVLQVDKSLLLDGTDHLLSVWGSTHMTP
jgi:hypothetical protein